ncbi:hypothetical protein B0H17DRAFT_1211658 [Mycena rosella]|uniref:Uncharacterized protein n=1 Tax=Mycena rosella TaxID=1033263 RepID=A0AAD7CU88_MYCRO|nr:hypothetical protein B0H17DRAFT_1211658 [Mycena rosella]
MDNALLRMALRSCALVAHTFVRPCETYFFHRLTLLEAERTSRENLYALFAERPHFASYVRALSFALNVEDKDLVEQLKSLTHTLGSMANLARLEILTDMDHAWSIYPAPLRESFSAVCGLPSMRHIGFSYMRFQDASELHTLLSKSAGLKTLLLRRIDFQNTSQPSASKRSLKRLRGWSWTR